MSAYRLGDTGYDHNLPNLDRQFNSMSLNEREYERPSQQLNYPQKAYRSQNNLTWWNGGKRRLSRKKRYTMRTTKKYLSRPSPPYPANDCCGMKKVGNDGAKYVSRPNANGICSWKKYKRHG
jgi:hypothetical protein